MSTTFKYVCRQDDENTYIMAGYSDFTGQFDSDTYKVISGPLPKAAQREKFQTKEEKLSSVINTQPVEIRAELYAIKPLITEALKNKDVGLVRHIITSNTTLSSTLKTKLATLLNIEIAADEQ